MVFAKLPWNRRVMRYGNLASANVRYGSWLCENSAARETDRINTSPKRIEARECF